MMHNLKPLLSCIVFLCFFVCWDNVGCPREKKLGYTCPLQRREKIIIITKLHQLLKMRFNCLIQKRWVLHGLSSYTFQLIIANITRLSNMQWSFIESRNLLQQTYDTYIWILVVKAYFPDTTSWEGVREKYVELGVREGEISNVGLLLQVPHLSIKMSWYFSNS